MRLPASNRISVGLIGIGNMGTAHLQSYLGRGEVQVRAVCEVDEQRLLTAKQSVDSWYQNSDCITFSDFRDLNRREDIDAVVIATPDHWHVIPAMDAIRNGKDAYVEKPLTLTINEGRELSDLARRYGSVIQTGSQQRSSRTFRHGCELVRNGRLGKLDRIEILIPANNVENPLEWESQQPPADFNYEMWLGPAPWAPFHPTRCHYSFRFLLDYSGGQVTNWGAHYLDMAQWALGMDESGPIEISGNGAFPETGLFTTAILVDFECLYSSGVRLNCRTRTDGVFDGAIKFTGSDGWLQITRAGMEASSESILRKLPATREIRLYESNDHIANFLDCVRTRRQPIANVEIGHRSATVCHLGNIAMLLERKLKWDPEREEFIADDEANRMRSRAMRSPWDLYSS